MSSTCWVVVLIFFLKWFKLWSNEEDVKTSAIGVGLRMKEVRNPQARVRSEAANQCQRSAGAEKKKKARENDKIIIRARHFPSQNIASDPAMAMALASPSPPHRGLPRPSPISLSTSRARSLFTPSLPHACASRFFSTSGVPILTLCGLFRLYLVFWHCFCGWDFSEDEAIWRRVSSRAACQTNRSRWRFICYYWFSFSFFQF